MPLPDKGGARTADRQYNFLPIISFERLIVKILKFALNSMLVLERALVANDNLNTAAL